MDITIFDETSSLCILWPERTGATYESPISIFGDEDLLWLYNPPRTDRHRIAGTVTVDGAPAERIVVAFDRRTLTYLGSTITDPVTGEWEITGVAELPERQLLVVALDTTGNYNAEVADYITQVTV